MLSAFTSEEELSTYLRLRKTCRLCTILLFDTQNFSQSTINGPLLLPFSDTYVFAWERKGSMASTNIDAENAPPLFSAVSGFTRQLFQLLRCINFVSKSHVQITKEGLRFTAEESQVVQGQSIHELMVAGDA